MSKHKLKINEEIKILENQSKGDILLILSLFI